MVEFYIIIEVEAFSSWTVDDYMSVGLNDGIVSETFAFVAGGRLQSFVFERYIWLHF